MSPEDRIRQLEQALAGVRAYVKVSHPKSLSRRDKEAKTLALLVIEAVIGPDHPEDPVVQLPSAGGSWYASTFVPPPDPKTRVVPANQRLVPDGH